MDGPSQVWIKLYTNQRLDLDVHAVKGKKFESVDLLFYYFNLLRIRTIFYQFLHFKISLWVNRLL